jgi:hypothetical protein
VVLSDRKPRHRRIPGHDLRERGQRIVSHCLPFCHRNRRL